MRSREGEERERAERDGVGRKDKEWMGWEIRLGCVSLISRYRRGG